MDKRPNEKSGQNMSNRPINSITAQTTPGSVPDPDEDNLDDLDGTLSHFGHLSYSLRLICQIDLLDEFSATKIEPVQGSSQPSSSGQLREDSHDPDSSAAAAAEFSKQLQDQMAALMGDVDESPEMRREIEAVMQELGAATDLEVAAFPQSQASAADASSNTQKPFQETIRKTMERMEASQQPAQATALDDSDDILAQMLKEMQSGGTDGAENEEDFSKMLMGMMEQLTNKDILFEPMQELHDKFPTWMQKNESSVKADDLKRYQAQQRLVGEIVEKFNEKGYSDSNPVDREFIVERMQQVIYSVRLMAQR